MELSKDQVNRLTGAVWLIGLGILFATRYWWPGVLFVAAAGSLTQAFAEGRGWYSSQGALWLCGLGIWFATGMNLAVLFVILGLSMLVGVFIRPPALSKPYVDNSLE